MTVVPRDFAVLAPPRVPAADIRYRSLLGEVAWASLPEAVRRRFSKPAAAGAVTIYRGQVVTTELSRVGHLLAQLARLIGGPLPLAGTDGPAVVTVIEEPAFEGQVWTRSYARTRRFPQVIHSAKCFTGPTGLEEYLGYGLVMRLTVSAEDGALVFRSAGYGVELFGRFLALPAWLTPGTCEVRHRDEGGGRFTFSLSLAHPLAGRLVHQLAVFEDPGDGVRPSGSDTVTRISAMERSNTRRSGQVPSPRP